MVSPLTMAGIAAVSGMRKPVDAGLFKLVPVGNSPIYKVVDKLTGKTVFTGNLKKVTDWLALQGIKL